MNNTYKLLMKKIKLSILFLAVFGVFTSFIIQEKGKTVTLVCELDQCEKIPKLYLFEFGGVGFEPKMETTAQKDGTFQFDLPKSKKHQFYYVGTEPNKVKSVIMGTESKVVLKGNCSNMRSATVTDGINKIYNESMAESKKLRDQQVTISRQYQRAAQDEAKRKALDEKLLIVDQKKKELLKTVAKKDPYVSKILALYTYYSFQNNKGQYENELDYFVDTYLSQADYKDKVYENLPMIFDAFNSYTTMLCKTRQFSKEKLDAVLQKQLTRIPEASSTYRFALGGMTMALRSQQNELFLDYGNAFLKKYNDPDSKSMATIAKQIKNAKSFMPGGQVPDFTAKTPEGKDMSLSDLRGKVVLVDFWASWCGPCRKENPHVVKLYEKYKDKGFEVLGVSLDKDMNRWKQAIEKDGLDWPHISDLKGWKSEPAKLYSVTSIPHTVLLDKEGKLIGRKLRGPQLDAKLKEIFGE